MPQIRKPVLAREQVLAELGREADRPVVIANPFAGRFAEDLGPLWEAGAAPASA